MNSEENKVKNFDDLKNLGCVSKVINIAGHEIKIKSLGFDNQSEMWDVIPDNVKETKKFDMLQKEILCSALESIDGLVLTREAKMDLLSKSQSAFVNLLYSEYEVLIGEQSKIFEDVKKNIFLVKQTP